jgi:phosphoribosylpyrophosphate synthetase
VLLDKFKGGETRVEIEESVRGKDVFIIQSGGGKGTHVSSPQSRIAWSSSRL